MSAWKDGPEGDGYYWIRLFDKDPRPEIVKVEGEDVYPTDGPQTSIYSPLVRDIQWQKVKPYEQ